jgi:RNA polymerase sigma-70 factor (ECF subfamily)
MQEAVTQQQQQAAAWTFEQLYATYYGRILACVRSLAQCSQEEAEDITQEAFVNAWQAFSSFDPTRPAFPWLYAIARNATYHAFRRKQMIQKKGCVAMPESAEKCLSDGSSMEKEIAVRESILRTLQAISPRYRDALLLRGVGGYRYQEIAERLGITLANTKILLQCARAAFKRHYAEEEVPV